ncbi:non-ribosomal peptide synthetase, partial [Bacillus wiedmannii]|uniref:non-ribosomal peptide synthetase n=1 Tax=Bacillus wiedmannii TaxID=1890302 RepID=UPI001F500CCF
MPKGVMIENRNIVNQVFWQIENGNYTEKSVIVQKTAFFFDGSAWEIFPCSVAGCKLSILNEDQNKDPGELIKLLPHNQIALTPSMLRMILEYIEDHDQAEVFQLINKLYLAAEPISKDLLERLRELMGGRFGNLCNLYGPTETTVTATSYHFSNQANIEKVPIGKPISNTQVYIMNGNTLCGIGVPGELCIAGAGVSRGYLNNPMLTAEKFVENPYKIGEKIYRTGDLACWLEDGNIEYLGRIDDQVKIRGFRIELGEIEEKIRTLPGIQDAVVVVKENNDEKYLCGYLVCKAEWNVSEIKMKLKSMLPDYMVPTYIMQIDKLPITRNGKLDKKALPCPEFVLAENYVAPRNKIESAIIEMYKEILHIEQVGIDNDFFELGGHSLKATVLVNSIE